MPPGLQLLQQREGRTVVLAHRQLQGGGLVDDGADRVQESVLPALQAGRAISHAAEQLPHVEANAAQFPQRLLGRFQVAPHGPVQIDQLAAPGRSPAMRRTTDSQRSRRTPMRTMRAVLPSIMAQ